MEFPRLGSTSLVKSLKGLPQRFVALNRRFKFGYAMNVSDEFHQVLRIGVVEKAECPLQYSGITVRDGRNRRIVSGGHCAGRRFTARLGRLPSVLSVFRIARRSWELRDIW